MKGLTMNIQTTINVNKSSYEQAKQILKMVGISYSQAIAIFNNMVILKNNLPFDIQLPNEETQMALDELENRDGQTFSSIDELFEDLEN